MAVALAGLARTPDVRQLVARDGFNEFVLLGKNSRTVTLVVTYDD